MSTLNLSEAIKSEADFALPVITGAPAPEIPQVSSSTFPAVCNVNPSLAVALLALRQDAYSMANNAKISGRLQEKEETVQLLRQARSILNSSSSSVDLATAAGGGPEFVNRLQGLIPDIFTDGKTLIAKEAKAGVLDRLDSAISREQTQIQTITADYTRSLEQEKAKFNILSHMIEDVRRFIDKINSRIHGG